LQKDSAAGCVSLGQKLKTVTERQYFTDIHYDITGLQSYRFRLKKKHKIRAITPFKVIEVGTNRKSVCDFLLMIDILSRTVSELSQLIVQILDTWVFEPPFGGLGMTYDVHLGLIGMRVVDFLLMLIELIC